MSNSVRPHRRQPTRLPRPWDCPGKNTGVGCHFLLQCMKVKVKSLSRVRLLATPWTAAHQAPPSMGFSRQEYWSGVPLPSLRHNLVKLIDFKADKNLLDREIKMIKISIGGKNQNLNQRILYPRIQYQSNLLKYKCNRQDFLKCKQ